MTKIRVLLADDHAIVRGGIRALLETQPDIDVVGEAEDGRAAIRMAAELKPDVAIIDVAMPKLNGLEATRQICQDFPNVKVLILTQYDHEEYIRMALGCGAMGYLTKDAAVKDLMGALRTIHHGEAVLSPAITRLVVEDYLRWGDLEVNSVDSSLSRREREVLQLIAEGYTNKEIAEILCISIKTVQSHRGNLMRKLDLHDRGELIKYAIQKKIIEL